MSTTVDSGPNLQGCNPLAERWLGLAVTLGKVDTLHLSSHTFRIIPENHQLFGALHVSTCAMIVWT